MLSRANRVVSKCLALASCAGTPLAHMIARYTLSVSVSFIVVPCMNIE